MVRTGGEVGLKEYIVEVNASGWITKAKQEIVRCKDCKWLLEYENGEWQCDIKQGWFPVKPEWFCADGIAKDTDVPNK